MFNIKSREINCKIVYCGPSLGGKTTNIKSLHDQLPAQHRSELQIIDTDDERTLFFDYFSVNLARIKGMQTKFLCYAVPGQDYYKATRKAVLQGVDGIVFVADSDASRLQDNITSLADLKALLLEHGYDYETTPVVLQFNKRDLPSICSVQQLNDALNDKGSRYVEAVAIDGSGVAETFKAVCNAVISRLNEPSSARI
ncbi:MAG: GTP-binding protein [Candidatus Sumerlaeaceae bacterium]